LTAASDGTALHGIEKSAFLILLVAVSLAFALVLWPFFGAILWAVAISVVFNPLYLALLRRLPGKRNVSALITLLVIIVMVVLPATLVAVALIEEAAAFYQRIQAGDIDPGAMLRRGLGALPPWAQGLLERVGLGDFDAITRRISAGLSSSAQAIAARALTIGQSAFGFLLALGVMLYLTFFLIRDGYELTRRIGEEVPLPADMRARLFDKFLTVIRATLKGSVVVAVVQGTLGGLTFWALGIHAALLWGVLMAFLSLLPAIGTGFVWVPVAIYLLATGSVWQGIVLVLVGVFVISLIDNVLRPILVGKDTRMPDYVVLITTLGGIQYFGVNGIIVGPMIAALFIASWHILTETRKRGGKDPSLDP
jgi:predicted PurR-regulated permease PerM